MLYLHFFMVPFLSFSFILSIILSFFLSFILHFLLFFSFNFLSFLLYFILSIILSFFLSFFLSISFFLSFYFLSFILLSFFLLNFLSFSIFFIFLLHAVFHDFTGRHADHPMVKEVLSQYFPYNVYMNATTGTYDFSEEISIRTLRIFLPNISIVSLSM